MTKRNKTKEIDDSHSRETKFLENLAIGLNVTEAGLKAGYSESYAKTDIRRKLVSPRFLAKLQAYCDTFPDQRRTLAKLRLPLHARIEDKIINKALEDVEFATRPVVAKTLERDYRIAGLLQDESAKPIMVQVNLALVQGQQEKSLESITLPDVSASDDKD